MVVVGGGCSPFGMCSRQVESTSSNMAADRGLGDGSEIKHVTMTTVKMDLSHTFLLLLLIFYLFTGKCKPGKRLIIQAESKSTVYRIYLVHSVPNISGST